MWGPPNRGTFDDDGGRNEDYFFINENMDDFSAIFQQMDDIFKSFPNFGMFPGFPNSEEFDIFTQQNKVPYPKDENRSLHDHILKDPNERNIVTPPQRRSRLHDFFPDQNFDRIMKDLFKHSFKELPTVAPVPTIDIDLDSQVAQDGLNNVLKKLDQENAIQSSPRNPWHQRYEQPEMRSFGFYTSKSTKRSADGTVETRVTEKDSKGNMVTTVTVTRPDGTREISTSENETIQSEKDVTKSMHDLITNNKNITSVQENLPSFEEELPVSKYSPISLFASLSNSFFSIFKDK